MGSKTKTSKPNNKRTSGYQGVIGPQREIKAPLGMGGGQSMAMAGNMGLAGATEAQALQIQKGLQNLGQPSSFQAIGQNIGEVGSKYRRPADIESYADRMQKINRALDLGGNIFTGPDEIERVNLAGTGIKDEQGRTILSMMSPELTATAPTMGQLGGDIGRAITGYNSLQYTDPTSNVPQMVRTQGLADVLAKAAIPGSMALNIIQDLYGKGKNFFFPEEEEETGFAPEGFTFPTNIQKEVGPTVDLRKPTVENLPSLPSISDYLSSGYGGQRISPEQQDLIDEFMEADERLQKRDTAGEVQGPSPQYLTDVESAFMYPKDYTIPFTDIQIPSLGNAIESAVTSGQGFDAGQNLTPAGEAVYDRLVEEFNFSPEDALERIKVLNNAGVKNTSVGALFADGGLTDTVPPKEGPMSAGVASLFKNK